LGSKSFQIPDLTKGYTELTTQILTNLSV